MGERPVSAASKWRKAPRSSSCTCGAPIPERLFTLTATDGARLAEERARNGNADIDPGAVQRLDSRGPLLERNDQVCAC